MKRIIFGSSNPNKAREIQDLLSGLVLVEASDVAVEIDETGSSCAANSLIKAFGYYKAQRRKDFDYVLADDSGIFVPHLGDNIPGVLSARFSEYEIANRRLVIKNYTSNYQNREKIDRSNNQQLLDYLKNAKDLERRAYFYAGLSLINSQGEFVDLFEGITFGQVGDGIVSDNGWGYDHVFISDSGNHWGKVSPEIKNLESHRFKAVNSLKYYLLSRENSG